MTTPTADLQVSIDGHDVTALVDTGADYSVISRRLATQLKKVTTEWNGPLIRTAGGHLVSPSGRCTSSVSIRGHTYLTTFVILEQCSRDLILGMDFLTDYGAIIDLPSKSVSFSTDHALPSDKKCEYRSTLRLLEEHVTLPPYSSRLIAVGTDSSDDVEGVAEGNRSLFLHRGISVARGVVQLHKGQAHVLLTNFSPEFQHLNTGTALAFVEGITEASSALNISEKCRFAYEELKFLGHIVNSDGVLPDPEKTAAVAEFPLPTDKKAVRRFLGLCAYYRRFVEGFSCIEEPLTRLTKDAVHFTWAGLLILRLRTRPRPGGIFLSRDQLLGDKKVPSVPS
ncbi:uncharacterized protein ISCGN_011848 [Ixodes scapularis]